MQNNFFQRFPISRWHFVTILLVVVAAALMATVSSSNSFRGDPEARVRACQVNLKQIATGLEMYATDNNGHYPPRLSAIVSTYLESLPACPSKGSETYSAGYQSGPDSPNNSQKYQDYFFLCCSGHQHADAGLTKDSPSFDVRLGVQPTLPFNGSASEGLEACQGKMKDIATALEMYSIDNNGPYPSEFAELIPNYLAAVPNCPVAGSDTYSATYEQGASSPHNSKDFPNFYYFSCSGGHHQAAQETDPAYDCIRGLLP